MSSKDVVVRVRGLSKSYSIVHQNKGSDIVPGSSRRLLNPFRRVERETFWALKDVNFDIGKGDVVGIVGRNGAGKSTLLKILSRITEPTAGRIELHGRVGSLLEVGTGFHPELTGRENIYLNGAILGMSRREIDRQFDAIVDFAGVEKFLDTPVKRYSSGMYVRLAFGVAAHLDSEILVVDEVLAVGDADFQRKCLGKMQDVAGQGRTVLFVSHNMAATRSLCSRAILLGQGSIIADGETEDVVHLYLSLFEQAANQKLTERIERAGIGDVRLANVEVSSSDSAKGGLATGKAATFTFHLSRPVVGIQILLAVYDPHGNIVTVFDSRVPSRLDQYGADPLIKVTCHIDQLTLVPGKYRANVALYEKSVLHDHVEGALVFEVQEGALGERYVAAGTHGMTVMQHEWDFRS